MKKLDMKKLICFLAAAAAAASLMTALALGIPEPSADFYTADYADVLSDETEKYVSSLNGYLESRTGGQIVVVTVDFTGDMSSENYAYRLFNSWGIGGKDNNGFLLLLVTGRDGYWMMPGQTTEKFLTAYELENIVTGGFLDYYDSGQYDAAVRYCVDRVYGAYSSYYGLDGQQQTHSGGSVVSRGAVLLILAVWFLFRICTPNRRRAGGFWNVFIPLSIFNSFSRRSGRYGGGHFGSGGSAWKGGGFGGGSAWKGGGFGSGGHSSGSHFGGGGHSRGGGVGR